MLALICLLHLIVAGLCCLQYLVCCCSLLMCCFVWVFALVFELDVVELDGDLRGFALFVIFWVVLCICICYLFDLCLVVLNLVSSLLFGWVCGLVILLLC